MTDANNTSNTANTSDEDTAIPRSTFARNTFGFFVALLTGVWSFIGLCWLALFFARMAGPKLQESPYFKPAAIAVGIASLVMAVAVGLIVFRLIAIWAKKKAKARDPNA